MLAKSLIQSGLVESIKIFYSYSRKDHRERDSIEEAIAGLNWDIEAEPWKRDKVLQWYDEGIKGGDEWDSDIKLYLNNADIILLFITNNFFDSDYIKNVELKTAIHRNNNGTARVVPILIDKTNPSWLESEYGHIQPLPQNCLPINDWDNKNIALNDVAQSIVNIIVSEGMFPSSRTRWQLRLDADLNIFENQSKKELIESLRELSEDSTLRFVKVKGGSVVFTMDSTKEGYRNIIDANQQGLLTEKIGFPVLSIIELFGAHVMGRVGTIGSTSFKSPNPLPDGDLILLPSGSFVPALLKGTRINKKNALHFNNFIDSGNGPSEGPRFNTEVSKLLEYLLTAIATPEDEMFVNLAPDKNARLLSETLMDTRLGRDFLEIDYRLKRLSSSLLHPDSDSGKEFWPKVFERAVKEIGTSELPFSTFQRVWVVPEKATVYEGLMPIDEEGRLSNEYDESDFIQGFVIDQYLKVLSKGDAYEYDVNPKDSKTKKGRPIINEVFEEIIVPIIEKEINEGESFAIERQIYNCMIIAAWIKNNKEKVPLLGKYIDSSKPRQLVAYITDISPYSFKEEINNNKEVNSNEPMESSDKSTYDEGFIRKSDAYKIHENKVYFEKYLDVFKNGVFYLERYDYDKDLQKKIPRVYFSGAIDFRNVPLRVTRLLKYVKFK